MTDDLERGATMRLDDDHWLEIAALTADPNARLPSRDAVVAKVSQAGLDPSNHITILIVAASMVKTTEAKNAIVHESQLEVAELTNAWLVNEGVILQGSVEVSTADRWFAAVEPSVTTGASRCSLSLGYFAIAW